MASPGSLNQDEAGDQEQQLGLDGFPSVVEGTLPNHINEDFHEYELDDQEYTFEEGSGYRSDTPESNDLSETEDLVEFPFREGRGPSLQGIWVTTTVTIESTPIDQLPPPPPPKMPNPNVPKPGPAKLTPKAGLAEWLSEAKQCHYLPETVMKQLCEMVKECLMEGEFSILAILSNYLLTSVCRVQYSACLHTSHDLR
jgi:hypothetical protein